MNQRTFDLHIVVWPAQDVPGQWLAHCLELDVVSQGNSLAHAVAMIREAVGLVLSDDLSKGLDPQRRRAPQEDWEAIRKRLIIRQTDEAGRDRGTDADRRP